MIDHSVMVDYFGEHQALKNNADLEYSRNAERYAFLRWGQTAFSNFRVVPPATGIVHQVNIEYLASVIFSREVSGNEIALTRFNNLAYYMSESLNRSLKFDMTIEEALPQAARLERFCQEFDLLAVIHIEPPPRKPVGKASVELIFDNSDGKSAQVYARFSEIKRLPWYRFGESRKKKIRRSRP